MKVFNMNSTVKVRLTAVGLKGLEDEHIELGKSIPYFRDNKFTPPKIDDDGYSQWQLHGLMQSLGHLCKLGFDLPFETNMLLNEEDLKERE